MTVGTPATEGRLPSRCMAIRFGAMPTPKIKATYSLEPETIRLLDRLARRWKVSKSEALRRAIRASASIDSGVDGGAISTLDRLQQAAGLTFVAAHRWARVVREERRSL